ncbi:uncharacterized protein LOC133517513 [Cydia pomonella]|uniref:uncharacterized protein LOC133517513 n=1 Tax=Cydia pomonella TaxID=82600 RepID=UPI002ADD9BB7|nr:uncharacterized protein LOC133517513 [Cydia pomonella]
MSSEGPVSVKVAAILEPVGLARDDGKRPDGMTLVPWNLGWPLVWDATCFDTLVPLTFRVPAVILGVPRPRPKTSNAESTPPSAVATFSRHLGLKRWGCGGQTRVGSTRLGPSCLIDATGNQKAGQYFAQRIRIAIQRGNAASLLGTLPIGSDLRDVFHL